LSKPFLRWVGSKQRLLHQISPYLPRKFGRYFEPFLGSAAPFFHLRPDRAFLSDTNSDLISTFTATRDHPNAILRRLRNEVPDRDTFYRIRSNRSDHPVRRAAEFIYLNKSCWNGLYRVNLKGEFNVPYGAPKSDGILDPSLFRQCSKLLQNQKVKLSVSDFEDACSHAKRGDFVFMDPPYVTAHNNNGFIEYNEKIFGWDDQIRLARLCNRLSSIGVFVLVTNANHLPLIDLYEGFQPIEMVRKSTLAGNIKARRKVSEVLLIGNAPIDYRFSKYQ
jgi:DNA adenine methylase